jgi:hypothetical protein
MLCPLSLLAIRNVITTPELGSKHDPRSNRDVLAIRNVLYKSHARVETDGGQPDRPRTYNKKERFGTTPETQTAQGLGDRRYTGAGAHGPAQTAILLWCWWHRPGREAAVPVNEGSSKGENLGYGNVIPRYLHIRARAYLGPGCVRRCPALCCFAQKGLMIPR